jgi:hypothetical protein
MPKVITKTVFDFDELDDLAKEHARDWFRQGYPDHEWWDCLYEDAEQCGKLIGIEIDDIGFSGFSSQGDGAHFEGRYAYKLGSCGHIRAHAPQDAELHRIADGLRELQSKHFYRLSATVKHSGYYQHQYCTDIDVMDDNTMNGDAERDVEEAIKELLRDFMRWIYRQLEQEYDYLTSAEHVDDTIRANEYTFTEDGRREG